VSESVLQREVGKKNPFEAPEQEATLNILRTADRLSGAFDELFRRHGITSPQYNVLRILRGHGEPVPSQQIGRELLTRVPDVTRLVDRLEKVGLVERARTSTDRRVVLVSITARGLELLAKLDRPVLDLHRAQLSHLTPDELAELNRLLVKARSAVSS
jgi:DNA-binding MarR family transcriptional regulator